MVLVPANDVTAEAQLTALLLAEFFACVPAATNKFWLIRKHILDQFAPQYTLSLLYDRHAITMERYRSREVFI